MHERPRKTKLEKNVSTKDKASEQRLHERPRKTKLANNVYTKDHGRQSQRKNGSTKDHEK